MTEHSSKDPVDFWKPGESASEMYPSLFRLAHHILPVPASSTPVDRRMEPLQEVELLALAEDVSPRKYSKLCNALEYTYAKGQAILEKHLKDVNRALAEILITWKTNQKETDQLRSILASKLHEVGLGDLGDSLSKGSYHLNRRDQRDRHDPETVPSPTWSAGACAYGQSQFDLCDQEMAPHSSDIYAKKISESLTVGKCREKLVNKYLNSYCKIQKAPWDPNDLADVNDLHTVVTMVKKDAHGKDTKMKEILQGSVTKIFSKEVNGVLPWRILISAPAGRGKTTAVAKMAYDWANRVQGSPLEYLPLLFLVKLRKTSKETSIAEAIRSQLLSDVTDLTQDGLHRFIKENQDICHILLDGLDEYAGIAASKGLGSNIVDVMLWEEFPDCRVLVTTRPHLENFFNQGELPRVYTKMWIEGFSYDSSREYIDKFFASTSNLSKAQGLKDYLDDKPLINELVITPLFCLMVCHLWNEGLLRSDTTTQTELLDNVNLFLVHHANARSKDKITEKKLSRIICKLGEVALDGLLDDAKKLVFTPHDFRKVPAILDEACELGIISKTIVASAGIPKASETTSTTIEFYHKLAQEHSAGKYLVDQTNKYLLRLKFSKLDRVLRKIKENIGEYENLIRFAAGMDNRLCIRIMERLLTNSYLDESERYRILLDCSSETSSTEGSVPSLIQRCVTAQSMVLKSPTVYTVVGMQNLPEQLISQIREVKFVDSGISADVTSGLWSCLGSFPSLRNLTISDSSLSFPLPPPKLQSVTNLKTERVMSESYEGLLSSLPAVEEIEVTLDNAERDISQITACLLRTGGQQLTRITLETPTSLQPEKKEVSRETMRRLGVLLKDQTNNLQMLAVSGVNCGDEEDLVTLIECCRHAKSLNCLLFLGCGSKRGGRLESYAEDILSSKERLRVLISHEMDHLAIEKCQLSTEMTIWLWSSLRFFTSLSSLTISDSSLSFPPSPPELTSVTQLIAKSVTSQSYEGLLSSLPGLTEINFTIDDADRDISQITACLRRTGGQQLRHMALEAPTSLQPEKKEVSRETMRRLGILIKDQTNNLQMLAVSGVNSGDEEDLVALVECCRHAKELDYLLLICCGSKRGGRLESYAEDLLISKERPRVLISHEMSRLDIKKYQLSTEMTTQLWSSLSVFTSLIQLTISDSSLSFPPSPPELTSVTKLKAERVTSQSYEGLLSSLPGLQVIFIIIDAAERDISQITAGLRRTGGQQLTHITLQTQASLPQEKKTVSRETMRGLGLLIREQTKNLQELRLGRVQCTDEDDLVDLIECCRHVKTMGCVVLCWCGTKEFGRLDCYLGRFSSFGHAFRVEVNHDDNPGWCGRSISHIG